MKKDYKIPLDCHGGVLRYAEEDVHDDHFYAAKKWVSREEVWELHLEFAHYSRGRSAAYFTFCDSYDRRRSFPFSMSEMARMIEQTVICRGCVSGKFRAIKQGKNYSMQYIEEI